MLQGWLLHSHVSSEVQASPQPVSSLVIVAMGKSKYALLMICTFQTPVHWSHLPFLLAKRLSGPQNAEANLHLVLPPLHGHSCSAQRCPASYSWACLLDLFYGVPIGLTVLITEPGVLWQVRASSDSLTHLPVDLPPSVLLHRSF